MSKFVSWRKHRPWYIGLALLALLGALVGVLLPSNPTVAASSDFVSINVERNNETLKPPAQPQRYSGQTTVSKEAWGFRYTLSNGDIVEVGDSSDPEFRASVKIIRYDGVCYFTLSQAGAYTPTLNGLTISFNFNASTRIIIYPVEASARLPEGGIEYDITLLTRPSQSAITLNADWQGITWQKLLALNVEYTEARCESDFGLEAAPYTITATSIVGSDGLTYKSRAEYEVNSYLGTAVNPHRETTDYGGGVSYTNLSTTQLYIHRGQMTDAFGSMAWVEDINLDQTAKTITFTLPRTWLRNAAYPISQVCGVDPAYTQTITSFQSTAFTGGDGVWSDLDITAYAADSAVVEIILSNSTTGTENTMGVRANGSSLARYVTLHEAEGAGGQTHCRMFVQTDASGIIECYHSDVSDADYFYVIGYWTNATFTEAFSSNLGSTPWGSNNWIMDAGANSVHHVILVNSQSDTANTIGVRAVGSSLERKILIHEPEAGGYNFLDMFVKSDANREVEVTSTSIGVSYYDTGYFSSELDFVEDWRDIAATDGSWQTADLSAYMDADGRVCDFLLAHSAEAATAILGVRDGDDATDRYLTEHEAESSGGGGEYTGFGMSAKSNATGYVDYYSAASTAVIYLTGYFKPAVAGDTYDITIDPGSKAFGVVANSTTYWSKGSAPSNPIQDAECTFTLTSTGSAVTDVDVHTHNFTGGVGWTVGAPGENQARLSIGVSGTDPASALVLTTADQELKDSLASGGHIHFDIKFESPTSVTDGEPKSTTITLTGRVHS